MKKLCFILRGIRGETMVETIVSMAMFAIIVAALVTVVTTSSNMNREAASTRASIAGNISEIEKKNADESDAVLTFSVDIGGTQKDHIVEVTKQETEHFSAYFPK